MRINLKQANNHLVYCDGKTHPIFPFVLCLNILKTRNVGLLFLTLEPSHE